MTHKDRAAKLRAVADLLEGLPDDVPGPDVVSSYSHGPVDAHWQRASQETAALVMAAFTGDWQELSYRPGVHLDRQGIELVVLTRAERCACGAPCDHSDGGAA